MAYMWKRIWNDWEAPIILLGAITACTLVWWAVMALTGRL